MAKKLPEEVVLVSMDQEPPAIVSRFTPCEDGHYSFVLPNGDRVHGAQLGWSNPNMRLLGLKIVTKKNAGEPVGADVSVRGKTLYWKVMYL